MKETYITLESALNDDNWEMAVTSYEDKDYTVFREIGMKEKRTLWLHIHESKWTGVFITERQFIRTVTTWEQLEILKHAMFGDIRSTTIPLN